MPAPAAPTATGPRRATSRRHTLMQWVRRAALVAVAVLAGLVVSVFSVDLGPYVKGLAERRASAYLERPMHIGKLSALLRPGTFELDDVVIEGLTKDARPFLSAKRIVVEFPWWTMFRKQIILQVRMTDWRMVIETFPNGRHNMPKLVPRGPSGGSRFTTTVRYVYADRGEFVYDDHGAPWSVVARNLNVDLVRANLLGAKYVGTARFSDGTVQIADFLPMRADLSTGFTLEPPFVKLHRIDLRTDGAQSFVTGVVDFKNWPEQTYHVNSQVDFARMKQIFFAKESWQVDGTGRFGGTFHLTHDGGRELKGDFTSPAARLNDLDFPNLRGSLDWLKTSFTVSHASSDFYGGRMAFDYGLASLGRPEGAAASFTADYADVDLAQMSRALGWQPLLLSGRATGRNTMTWQNGHFGATYGGEGAIAVAAPDGVTLAPAALPEAAAGAKPATAAGNGTSAPFRVGGEVHYRFDPTWLEFDDSWMATPETHVGFHGRSAYLDRANIRFHVTSADWQESDRVLAAIMTKFQSPTSVQKMGGRGTFDGVMTDSFRAPRIEGKFDGDDVRAWDVTWGHAAGEAVIQNSYVRIADGVVTRDGARIHIPDGLFSLGFPRKDEGEELHGRFQLDRWPLADFRAAFGLTDWPVEGTATADISLAGPYKRPVGTGSLTIEHGVAWKETFDRATAAMAFEGNGLRLNRIDVAKGPGAAHGVMWIGWDNTYSFDADGDRIPIESLKNFTVPNAPLTGVLKFSATGAGSFAAPSYDFDGRVADLFAGDEGIGQVSGHLKVKNHDVTIEKLEASSGRLQVSGSGSISFNETTDADMTFRYVNTSIDPYLKYLKFLTVPVSDYTRAIVTGTLHVKGDVSDPAHLLVDARVEDARLTLFDYDLHNDGLVHMMLDKNVVDFPQVKLVGQDTSLELHGQVPLADAPMSLTLTGDANLAILQAFGAFHDVRASGTARLQAQLEGRVSESPVFSGQATIADGRIRHPALPRSLEAINGAIRFDATGIDVSGLHAQMGGGPVVFGGNVALRGFKPDEFNLNATGTSMQLRYQGLQATVNANLSLQGPVSGPALTGDVAVLHGTYVRSASADAGLLSLAAGGAVSGSGTIAPTVIAEPSSFPVTLNIRVLAPSTLHLDNADMHLVGSTEDLVVRGTPDKVVLTGRVDVRGQAFFLGNRYTFTDSSIDFSDPTRIEPYLDVGATTVVRLPGQTYNIAVRATGAVRTTGTSDKLSITATADPALPTEDIYLLLMGESPDVGRAELRALGSPQATQQQFLASVMAQVLASPISSRVGSVFERTIPLDTVQITPLLGSDTGLQQLNPGARLTFGKRISDRVFLTYSRDLNTSQAEVIVLEYAQSDRLSWVLSRNEDHTFALDFRIRHVF